MLSAFISSVHSYPAMPLGTMILPQNQLYIEKVEVF